MYTLGVDVGSTTSKCVLLKDGKEIVATSLLRAGTGADGPTRAQQEVLEKAGLTAEDVGDVMATGYGRKTLKTADGEMSELSCHAKGISFMYPNIRTIIDIGGQDRQGHQPRQQRSDDEFCHER